MSVWYNDFPLLYSSMFDFLSPSKSPEWLTAKIPPNSVISSGAITSSLTNRICAEEYPNAVSSIVVIA